MREELEDVVNALDTVPELSALLENPEIESHVKARVLDEVLGGADELVRNFVRLAVEKGRAGEIRAEVAELALVAAAKVTGRALDADDDRRLIDEAVSELDFSALEEARS